MKIETLTAAKWYFGIALLGLSGVITLPLASADAQLTGNSTDELGDPLPVGVLRRLGTTRLSHRGHASCVAYSPDGKLIASGGYDGAVTLWDAKTAKEVRRFQVPCWVRDVVWSPESDRLFAASDGDGIRCWETTTGKLVHHFAGQKFVTIAQLALSADGKVLASGEAGCGSSDGPNSRITVWDVVEGKQVHRVEFETVYTIALSPDGKLLAVGGNKAVRLVDVVNGKEEPPLAGDPEGIYAVAFSPDGKYLAASGLHGTPEICVWEIPSRREVHRLGGHSSGGGRLVFSPDSKTLISTGMNFESAPPVIVWDVASGKKLHTWGGVRNLHGISFSPDCKTIATVGGTEGARMWGERSIRLRDVATGQDLQPFAKHHGEITSIAITPDGNTLATASWDHNVHLWNSATGKQLFTLRGHTRSVYAVAFSPDGLTVATGSGDRTIRFWDRSTSQERRHFQVGDQKNRIEVAAIAYSPDGRKLATADGVDGDLWISGMTYPDCAVRLWDLNSDQEIRQLKLEKVGRVNTIAFSPDGRILVSAGLDSHAIRFWDPATGAEVRKILGPVDPRLPDTMGEGIVQVVFSSDGKTLASVSDFDFRSSWVSQNPGNEAVRNVRLWDVETGDEQFQIRLPRNTVRSVSFSQDGKYLVAGKNDGTLSVWDLATKKEIKKLPGHGDRVSAIIFSPDGKTFATGSWDTTALLWDAKVLEN